MANKIQQISIQYQVDMKQIFTNSHYDYNTSQSPSKCREKIFTKQCKQTDKIARTQHSQTGVLSKSEIMDSGDSDTAVRCLDTPER